MKYFFISLSMFLITLCSAQSRLETANLIEKQYLQIEENINDLVFHGYDDKISFHTNADHEIIKITTKRNGNIEYYFYDSGASWPKLVRSNDSGHKHLFFFDLTKKTARIFFWKKDGVNIELNDHPELENYDKDFFETGKNLKIILENSQLKNGPTKALSYLDSLKNVRFTPSVGTYELKDTAVTDEFDGSTQNYSFTLYDSTFISTDANITLRKEYIDDELHNTRQSSSSYKDVLKNCSLTINRNENLENSFRLKDKTATKTEITTVTLANGRCYKGTQLTKDYITFETKWEILSCK